MKQNFGKIRLSTLLLIVFSSVFINFYAPAPASAFPVEITADFTKIVDKVQDKIEKGIAAAIKNAGIKAASYAMRKVAYDSAVWIASGGKGQGALAFKDGFGDYLGNVANEAAGAAIDELSKEYGMNLCQIPNIKVDLALKIGLRTRFSGSPEKPNCTGVEFLKNWQTGFSKYTSGDNLIKSFNTSLKADDSDFGIYLAATEKINGRVMQQRTAAVYDRQEGEGFKPLTAPISGDVKTPAQTVKDTASGKGPMDKILEANEEQLNAALASGDIKVFPTILGIFLNTLGSNIINNFQTKGILPFGACIGGMGGESCKKALSQNIIGSNPSDSLEYGGAGLSSIGRTVAQSFFNYLSVVQIKESTNYDLLGQLNSCPESPGVYNCRLGEDMLNAINQKLTFQEAIDKGVIDGEKILVPPVSQSYSEHTDTNCFENSFCLNDVKVLRQVRILPLGFEIAVLNSNSSTPWKLKEVVDGFNVVGSPYYHLIDPNWVLKAPESKCNALVNGQTLLGQGLPNRLQDCVDLQTCVSYNSNGNCAKYAYCTREKNTWNFAADSCESQFATCRTYIGSDGKSSTYLSRTLNTDFCNQSNVGCTAYSLQKDISGNWASPQDSSSANFNSWIYLSKVESCSSQAAGCSAFQIASGTVNLYLKKAPDYLRCYDSDPSTPNVVNWPKNPTDIAKIQGSQSCSSYASVCTADEVSCSWYKPLLGGERIPGRFKPAEINSSGQIVWNDQCDAKCVGYDTYKEMPSNYSGGQDLAYIIPSSGQSCTASEVGCTAFTNLSSNSSAVEYFSYLRPCTSNIAEGKTFITYEGTKESGFQLITYVLVPDETGGPKYFYRTDQELLEQQAECTAERYKSGVASLDCRQFNDPDGNVHYRLMSKTIPATDKCTPYRINKPEFYKVSLDQTSCTNKKGFWDSSDSSCKMCLQNGEFKNGSCYYEGIPSGISNNAGTSQGCSAAVETCRAYKGNAGNNIQTVLFDNFETGGDKSGWSPVGLDVVPVSTRVGEHSLNYDGSGTVVRTLNLEPAKTYELTFWALGPGENLRISLVNSDGVSANFGEISLASYWREYKLGPVEFKATTNTARLEFALTGSSKYYLDNVKLVKIIESMYLVKKTLKVDPVCDSNLQDNLPGEGLGCKAYSDTGGRQFYLTNFSFLCRESAVGCTALIDTQNTLSETGGEIHNIWLTGPKGGKATAMVGGNQISCDVPGQGFMTGCYTSIKGVTLQQARADLPATAFVPSTVYIPPDTSTSSPIYLVANQTATCNQTDLGCTFAGIERKTPTSTEFITTTIKNNPAFYAQSLCQSEAVGCEAFSNGSETKYFKDPVKSGQKICVFRTDVLYNGNRVSGWFVKDPEGTCTNNSNIKCTASTAASACGSGNSCKVSDTLCYNNDFDATRNLFEMWSYGSADYKNAVGECPEDKDMCTQFIDHGDNDKSYFLIKDDKINSGDCSGQVSRKYGCALFDEAENPRKYWDTMMSYGISESNGDKLIAPTSTPGNNANTIIKVVRDRICGEWLECGRTYSDFDEQTNKYKTVCIGSLLRCSSNGSSEGCLETGSGYSNELLSQSKYQSRSTIWSQMDYSGLSILGSYPVEELEAFNFNTSSEIRDIRIGKKISSGTNNNATYGNDSTACKISGQACGTNGWCVNNICITSPTGKIITNKEEVPKQICRGYPEIDSPFPRTDRVQKHSFFSGAKICDQDQSYQNGYGCECDYRKVQYGDSLTKYWSFNTAEINDDINGKPSDGKDFPGICISGTTTTAPGVAKQAKGLACVVDDDCGKGGSCQALESSRTFLGWKGFCLENDSVRKINGEDDNGSCLTWYPVEGIPGNPDINNQHLEAGNDWHEPQVSGGYYCVKATGQADSMNSATISFSPTGLTTDRSTAPNLLGCSNIAYSSAFGNPYCTNVDCGSSGGCDYKQNLFSRGIIDIENGIEILSSGNRVYSNANGLKGITKQNISAIEIGAVAGTEGYFNINGSSGPYYLIPNDAPNGLPQSYYRLRTDQGTAAILGGFYRKDPNEMIFFYSSSAAAPGSSSNGIDINTGQFGYGFYKGSISLPGLSGNVFDDAPLKAGSLEVNDIWDAGVSNNYNNSTKVGFCPTSPTDSTLHDDGNEVTALWHAIRFKFDPVTKRLVNIYTAFCGPRYENTYGGEENVSYQIIFHTKEWCSVVADAQINPMAESGPRAIAWTSRLFSVPSSPYSVAPPLNYNYASTLAPFGSLAPIPYNLTGVSTQVSISELPNISACTTQNSILDASNPTNCNNLADKLFVSAGGKPYSCDGGLCAEVGSRSITDTGVAMDHLLNVFSRITETYQYDLSQGKYVVASLVNNYTDRGKPPQINAPTTCQIVPGKNSETGCIEDTSKLGFSVGGKTSGDVLYDSYSKTVEFKFFMHADENQMPLKRISFAWGDGSSPTSLIGSYRNKRGYKSFEPVDPFCKPIASAPNYGQIEDKTCDSGVFSVSNPYTCTPAKASASCPAGYPNGCCVFIPKIQVKDNWGWCNGSCPGGPGGDYCLDQTASNSTGTDECATSNSGPWTSFSGRIILPLPPS